MTKNTVANRLNEDRGKIGPWDVAELCELVAAFHEVGANVEHLIALERAMVSAPPPSSYVPERIEEYVDSIRRALLELTKGLAGTVVAGAPELAGDLAQSFFIFSGSTGVAPAAPLPEVQGFEPITAAVLSTQTRQVAGAVVDVALLRLAFNDAESGAPGNVDAVLVKRNRSTDERTVVHFPASPASRHFDQAIETRAIWLGLADGDAAAAANPYPCT